MILGPIGQKWVCAAGVERSTLHRCGLTGLGLIKPFFHSKIGPWSVTFPGRDREISGSHKKEIFIFAPKIKRKGSLSSWPIENILFIIIESFRKIFL
jgi:hypothetical protein